MKKVSYIIFLLLVLFCVQPLKGQDVQNRKNAVYVEFGGNGGLISFNYDRIFSLNDRLSFVARLGATEWSAEDAVKLNFLGIIDAGLLFGYTKHFVDVGLGFTFPFNGPSEYLFPIRVGYRYQGLKGLLVRIIPMYMATNVSDSFGNSIWFGASIGFLF